jgi:hypothetical protein
MNISTSTTTTLTESQNTQYVLPNNAQHTGLMDLDLDTPNALGNPSLSVMESPIDQSIQHAQAPDGEPTSGDGVTHISFITLSPPQPSDKADMIVPLRLLHTGKITSSCSLNTA